MATKRTNTPQIDRLPPNSSDAEKAVLGACILSPKDCVPRCVERLPDGPGEMYDLPHQTILATMISMSESASVIDLVTLQQNLKDRSLLDQCGGIDFLSRLPDFTPSAANLDYWLDIVHEKHLLRKMIRCCVDSISRIYDYEGDVERLFDEFERDVLAVRQSRSLVEIKGACDLVKRAIGNIEEMQQKGGTMTGIATGFRDFDQMTCGLHPGEMIVIAARPSIGKTSLAMNIAEHVAVDQKIPVGVFSLEMTADSLMLRMLCSRAEVNLRDVREGFLAERDVPKIVASGRKLSTSPLFIEDSSGLSIMQLRAKGRRMHQQFGVKLIVVDYIQLLHSTARRAENRQQEIADISSGLKALSKELGIPIIVLSQLNREVERERNRAPRLSDLRESGAIEQDADLVGLLYRPKTDDEDAPMGNSVPVNLMIAKQRNGPTGDVNLTFIRRYTRFESVSKVADRPNDQQGDMDYREPHNS